MPEIIENSKTPEEQKPKTDSPGDQEQTPVVNLPESESKEEHKSYFLRFRISDRIEHWVFITSFLILGLTGLVQRYATVPFSQSIIRAMGGIESTRQIHHVAAVVMMLSVIYHVGAIIYKLYVRRVRPTMLPGSYDFIAAWDTVKYFIGRRKHPAQQGRYTFEEKVEYWAVVWGTIIMGLTGFFMWNPILITKFLPGEAIPAAKYAHSMEAVLAVLSIVVWHFYHIFVKTFNNSMFTGKLSQEQMVEEHPLELADINAGIATRPIDPGEKEKRRKIFFPTYSVLAAVMLIGVYFFVNYEETAITTVPPAPEKMEVFVPLTPTPLPTPLPTSTPFAEAGALTWIETIGPLFQQRCAGCHGADVKLGDLDLSTYSAALEGGASGVVIIPGDPENSLLVQNQSAGGHPGQLSPQEIDLVAEWIENGAPE
jgi:formate dehydrogenase gamma subunit